MPSSDGVRGPTRGLVPLAALASAFIVLFVGIPHLILVMRWRRDCRVAAEIERLGGQCHWQRRGPPRFLRVLGGRYCGLFDRVDYVTFRGQLPVDVAAPALLGRLGDLQALMLNSVRVTDAWLAQVGNLTELRSLHFCGSTVTDDGLRHLAGLKKLNLLCLAGTRVTGPGLAHLEDLDALSQLNLQCSSLEDEGIVYLCRMKALRQVNLNRSKVTKAAVARLRRALPGTQVIR